MLTGKFLFLMLFIVFSLACQTFSGLMKKSGLVFTIEVKTDEPNPSQVTEQAAKILQKRLDAFGVSSDVSKISENRLEAKIYGTFEPERVKQILVAQSKFELRKVISPPSPAPLQTYKTKAEALASLGGQIPSNRKILAYAEYDAGASQSWVVVEHPSIVDGNELRDASAVSYSSNESDYQIAFSLNPSGAQKFGEWTAQNIGNYVAIVLNDEVKSAAYIKSQITDSGEISGRFTKQQAEDLALIMKSGYLPATLVLVEEKTFGK